MRSSRRGQPNRGSLRACRREGFPNEESTSYRQAAICRFLILCSRKSISDRLLICPIFFFHVQCAAMPRRARCVLPGNPYHVTQRRVNRRGAESGASRNGRLRGRVPVVKRGSSCYCPECYALCFRTDNLLLAEKRNDGINFGCASCRNIAPAKSRASQKRAALTCA